MSDRRGERITPLPDRLLRAAAQCRAYRNGSRARILEEAARQTEYTIKLLKDIKPRLPLQTPMEIITRINLAIAKAEGK